VSQEEGEREGFLGEKKISKKKCVGVVKRTWTYFFCLVLKMCWFNLRPPEMRPFAFWSILKNTTKKCDLFGTFRRQASTMAMAEQFTRSPSGSSIAPLFQKRLSAAIIMAWLIVSLAPGRTRCRVVCFLCFVCCSSSPSGSGCVCLQAPCAPSAEECRLSA